MDQDQLRTLISNYKKILFKILFIISSIVCVVLLIFMVISVFHYKQDMIDLKKQLDPTLNHDKIYEIQGKDVSEREFVKFKNNFEISKMGGIELDKKWITIYSATNKDNNEIWSYHETHDGNKFVYSLFNN